MNLFEAWIERKEPLSFSFSGWRREWKTWANGKHVFVSPFDKNVAFDEIFRSSETVAARRQRRRGTPFKSNKIFFSVALAFSACSNFLSTHSMDDTFSSFSVSLSLCCCKYHFSFALPSSALLHPHHSTQKHNFLMRNSHIQIYMKKSMCSESDTKI